MYTEYNSGIKMQETKIKKIHFCLNFSKEKTFLQNGQKTYLQ